MYNRLRKNGCAENVNFKRGLPSKLQYVYLYLLFFMVLCIYYITDHDLAFVHLPLSLNVFVMLNCGWFFKFHRPKLPQRHHTEVTIHTMSI